MPRASQLHVLTLDGKSLQTKMVFRFDSGGSELETIGALCTDSGSSNRRLVLNPGMP